MTSVRTLVAVYLTSLFIYTDGMTLMRGSRLAASAGAEVASGSPLSALDVMCGDLQRRVCLGKTSHAAKADTPTDTMCDFCVRHGPANAGVFPHRLKSPRGNA